MDYVYHFVNKNNTSTSEEFQVSVPGLRAVLGDINVGDTDFGDIDLGHDNSEWVLAGHGGVIVKQRRGLQ